MPFRDALFQILPLGVVYLTGTLDIENSVVEELTSVSSGVGGGGVLDSRTYLVHLFGSNHQEIVACFGNLETRRLLSVVTVVENQVVRCGFGDVVGEYLVGNAIDYLGSLGVDTGPFAVQLSGTPCVEFEL